MAHPLEPPCFSLTITSENAACCRSDYVVSIPQDLKTSWIEEARLLGRACFTNESRIVCLITSAVVSKYVQTVHQNHLLQVSYSVPRLAYKRKFSYATGFSTRTKHLTCRTRKNLRYQTRYVKDSPEWGPHDQTAKLKGRFNRVLGQASCKCPVWNTSQFHPELTGGPAWVHLLP